MSDFLMLMHGDAVRAEDDDAWEPYFRRLRASGVFEGGSTIGGGKRFRKGEEADGWVMSLTGFIRLQAADLAEAETFLAGNPVYESGGTIEIRELPRD